MRISDWGSDGCSSDLGCASGAGVAGTSRRRSLSRLASDCRARERPRRSEKTPLYLLATGLDRPCYFGRRKDRLPRTALPLRLARGHQRAAPDRGRRSEEHTSELQSLMRISYAVFCLKKKKTERTTTDNTTQMQQ